jgi:beta propeller repeat protein
MMTVLMFTSTAQAAYSINRFAVCTDSGDQANPDIDGDTVVWEDADSDIHWAQIGSASSAIIADGTQTYPAVSGDIVAWYNNNTQRDICTYNLQAGGVPVYITNDAAKQWYPDISGDYIVYEHLDGFYNIYLYDDTLGSSVVIEAAAAHQLRPAIDGTLAVWGDGRDDGFANYDIYYCDLSVTPYEAYLVSGSANDQWNPAVSGSVIVWREDPGDGSGFNIYGYDLTDQATGRFPICTASGNQEYPAISGNIVVWEDQSDLNIWAFDLDNRAEGAFRVSDGTGTNKSPAISGKTIVWEKTGDIVGAELLTPTTVTVTAPVGGESLEIGQPTTITWTTTGPVTHVEIEFSPDGKANWTPVATISDTGSYAWIPTQESTDCWIQITNVDDETATDTSDAAFTVYSIPNSITLTDPNGGEMVLAGSELEIQWTSVGDVNDVVILFSPDNEQTWQTVTASTANDGAFTWDAVPADANSVQCLIHISDVADSSTWDMNDEHFTVFQCKTSLTADLTGDCFVDVADIAELARQWLECGNPHDPAWCLGN